ncbi:hypothetical protein Ancab_013347 [Ancistrocladus abbreviatus]
METVEVSGNEGEHFGKEQDIAFIGNVEVYCGWRKVSVIDELAQETTRPIVNYDQEATSDLLKCLEVLCSREIDRKRSCHAMASFFSADCGKSRRNKCRVRSAEPKLAQWGR